MFVPEGTIGIIPPLGVKQLFGVSICEDGPSEAERGIKEEFDSHVHRFKQVSSKIAAQVCRANHWHDLLLPKQGPWPSTGKNSHLYLNYTTEQGISQYRLCSVILKQ